MDSLPVDQWEISPDQIIMDKQLGSGNFGEVFLGKLIGAITTPGVGTYIGTRSVAVKLLKSNSVLGFSTCKCMIAQSCIRVYHTHRKFVSIDVMHLKCMVSVLITLSNHTIDDAGPELKVDFLKEISTMKKISLGRCPHVVNMVGCCTLQEPLALVLEYASYGDLLEYLRTMRRVSICHNRYFAIVNC